MINKEQICEKITSIYPDIGECGIDVNVDYDAFNNAWVVGLKKGNRELNTYLEPTDADVCVIGKKCIGLGVQIAQLRSNIDLL